MELYVCASNNYIIWSAEWEESRQLCHSHHPCAHTFKHLKSAKCVVNITYSLILFSIVNALLLTNWCRYCWCTTGRMQVTLAVDWSYKLVSYGLLVVSGCDYCTVHTSAYALPPPPVHVHKLLFIHHYFHATLLLILILCCSHSLGSLDKAPLQSLVAGQDPCPPFLHRNSAIVTPVLV